MNKSLALEIQSFHYQKIYNMNIEEFIIELDSESYDSQELNKTLIKIFNYGTVKHKEFKLRFLRYKI